MFWRIYYADRRLYDYPESPFDAPPTGVQIIWCELPGCSGLIYRHNYYWWDRECWWGGDEPGVWQYRFRPGAKRELYGASIATELFESLLKMAIDDRRRWLDAKQ